MSAFDLASRHGRKNCRNDGGREIARQENPTGIGVQLGVDGIAQENSVRRLQSIEGHPRKKVMNKMKVLAVHAREKIFNCVAPKKSFTCLYVVYARFDIELK